MIFEVPLSAEPSQVVTTTLHDVEYDLAVKWSDIAKRWTLDIVRTSDQEPLARGLSLVLGVNIMAGRGLDTIGSMFVVDTSRRDEEASDAEGDLGGRVRVYFMTPDEAL